MARLFDDLSSEYLEIDSSVITTQPLTMAAWVYSDSATLLQAILSVADKDSATKLHFLELAGTIAGDPVRMASITVGSPSYAATTTGYSVNTWHHAAGVVSASNARAAYIDGGSEGTDATEEDPGAVLDRTSIGRLGDSTPAQYFSGNIAEAAVWNIALTIGEIAILAKGFSPLFVRPQNLVAYWPLINTNDIDIVGGFNMTAFNTPSVATHPRIYLPTGQYTYY
ncbi:MAG: hypothetical protein A2W11_00760 [Ignavibacteria bacterium RBG_16_35_7]|nr:MAG: hypothetical protein A2W11_00760 [Ignavibacteria bacterium RBG_16_35_7]